MAYIYKITNKINSHSYVGQTGRIPELRWKEHLRDKNKKPFSNWPLYRALNKYGEDNFTFEIIEETLFEEVIEREQYWINYFDTYNNGYNATMGGAKGGYRYDYNELLNYWLNEGNKNFTETAKHFGMDKSHLSDIIKGMGCFGRTFSEINKENVESKKRKVNQIDLSTGKVISSFSSLTEAEESLGFDLRSIQNVCQGRHKSHKNFGWQYAEDIGKPIYLNGQWQAIRLPEFDLEFINFTECSKFFIEKKISRSEKPYEVSKGISYALKHSGKYMNIKIEPVERKVITYYE